MIELLVSLFQVKMEILPKNNMLMKSSNTVIIDMYLQVKHLGEFSHFLYIEGSHLLKGYIFIVRERIQYTILTVIVLILL